MIDNTTNHLNGNVNKQYQEVGKLLPFMLPKSSILKRNSLYFSPMRGPSARFISPVSHEERRQWERVYHKNCDKLLDNFVLESERYKDSIVEDEDIINRNNNIVNDLSNLSIVPRYIFDANNCV